MTYTDPAAIAAIRDAIRSEQNYVFACGLAGAQLKGGGRRRAVNQLADRRQRIEVLTAMIDEAEVPSTPPAFEPPTPIDNARSARRALVDLNNALVGTYAQMAATTEGDDRSIAVASAQDCARTAVQWGGASQAFPTAE